MSDEILAALSGLIKRGRFRQAYAVGTSNADVASVRDDANFHFQVALASGFVRAGDTEAWWARARKCPNCTQAMESDMLRDSARMAVLLGQLDEAQQLLATSASLAEGDRNRQAAVKMVWGLISAARHEWGTANQFHRDAEAIWRQLGDDADEQWMRDNRFHWFAVMVMLGQKRHIRLGMILEDEPRRDRRIRLLIWHYGLRPAVLLDQYAMRWWFRH
ncbi:hypothetical protein JNJ66_00100 [Candidatus Saccharibacteria bacterium]|nr:hypothetical protein [Candidatus Saccharibacteria bacterium]